MKTIGLLMAFAFSLFYSTSQAQVLTDTLLVAGDCNHCKERIEQTVDLPGVKYAAWNNETQQLIIEYKANKISISEISDALRAVGHDTEYGSAPDAVYQELPGCCRYERLSLEQQKSGSIK